MSRIILIEIASNVKDNFINPNKLEPLGIEYVGAHALNHGYSVDIISDTFEDVIKKVNETNFDDVLVVGISAFTYSFTKGLSIANKIKQKNEDTIIVFGGIHASSCPELVNESSVDYVILGEGEYRFISLLEYISGESDALGMSGIVGKSIIDRESNILSRSRKEQKDNTFVLSPIRKKEYIASSKMNGLIYPALKHQSGVAQIIQSRGCKYDCDYCSSSLIFGRTIRYREISSVISEMKYLIDSYDVNLLYFADINFSNSKRRMHELCDSIIANKYRVNWYCLLNIRGLDRDTIERMKSAGCSKIGVGIETIVPEKNKDIAKCEMRELKTTLTIADEYGMLIRAFLMIGLPNEEPEDLESMPKVLSEMPIDELRIPFFTPFPGTRSHEKYRDRLYTDDYDRYSTNEPMVINPSISKEKYLDYRSHIYKMFYTSKIYQTRMKDKVLRNPQLKESYNAFFEELFSEGIL